ncbi:MAG: hypothetical protein JHC95_08750 [Solirubrobacteraceae bacterium]|nr:hypothetical protein [Solirubrobacteraceae bacterium]
MGRRSRKRADLSARADPTPVTALEPSAAPSRRAARRAARGEAPKPFWAPFPLAELVILLGIVCIVGGLIWGGGKGQALLGCGVGLICLAALEVALREHLAGYRSHSALIALVPTAVTLGVLTVVVDLPGSMSTARYIGLGAAAIVFLTCFLALREVFRRRSGGLSFRA